MSDIGTIKEHMPCRKCGYDLIGLDANPDCPECGTLNLHAEPYRGVEVFRYCPHRHSKTLLILIGLFAVFSAVTLLDGHSGSNPPQRPPSRPYGFLLGVGTVIFAGYAIARYYSSNGKVSLDWDSRKITLEHTVCKRFVLPMKRRILDFEMNELKQVDKASPLGSAYDLLRMVALHRVTKHNGPAWTCLRFPEAKVYIHRAFDDIELLELRLSRLCANTTASIPVSKRVFKLPLAVAILVILGATATLVWLAIRNEFWI